MKNRVLSLLVLASLLISLGMWQATPSVLAQDDEIVLYVTDDGSLGIAMPSSWVATGSMEDGLTVASSQELLDSFLAGEEEDMEFPQGGFGMIVFVIPIEQLNDETGTEMGLADLAVAIAESAAASDGIVYGEVTEVDVQGITLYEIAISDEDAEGFLYTFQLNADTYGVSAARTHLGEAALFQELAQGMSASVRYSVPLDETFDDGSVEFNYPTDWFAEGFPVDEANTVYMIYNDEQALADDEEDLQPGQYLMMLTDVSTFGVSPDGELEAVAAEFGAAFQTVMEDEDTTLSEVAVITLNEIPFALIEATNEDGEPVGGIIVAHFVTEPISAYAIIYGTAPGERSWLSLTAFNILRGTLIAVGEPQ